MNQTTVEFSLSPLLSDKFKKSKQRNIRTQDIEQVIYSPKYRVLKIYNTEITLLISFNDESFKKLVDAIKNDKYIHYSTYS